MERKDYNIYTGLSGSFGGGLYQGTLKNVSEQEAYECAYDLACDEFDRYEGSYGICDYDDFVEEYPEGTEEDYEDFKESQKESWMDYFVVPTEEDDEVNESEIEYLDD